MIDVEEELEKLKRSIYLGPDDLRRKYRDLSRRLAEERDRAVEIAARLAIDCGVEAPTKKWVIQQIEKKG